MVKTREIRPEDIERELPPAEDDGVAEEAGSGRPAVAGATDELRRVKEERDLLFDRLARLQAEFENYRKRSQREQLFDALAKLGLREVPAEGEPFDPQYHQAVEMVDTSEAPDHQVVHELQRGYKLKDRLLRPAMVRVARNPKS